MMVVVFRLVALVQNKLNFVQLLKLHLIAGYYINMISLLLKLIGAIFYTFTI